MQASLHFLIIYCIEDYNLLCSDMSIINLVRAMTNIGRSYLSSRNRRLKDFNRIFVCIVLFEENDPHCVTVDPTDCRTNNLV